MEGFFALLALALFTFMIGVGMVVSSNKTELRKALQEDGCISVVAGDKSSSEDWRYVDTGKCQIPAVLKIGKIENAPASK